ncbi:hypothetical protein CEXT_488191 [Caerostris extrusa]|uniref:Uncharacterized protein n=1 Tax=Caerostris extrusa TaxID=172846 RepID=A0AAV4XKL2_CAEEX|nr:hypothetical protein CEXT_488191 [Caerostris extrusa]
MLFDRRPKDPLSTLNISWTDKHFVLYGQLRSLIHGMNDMEMMLERTREYIGLTAAGKQQVYAFYHNRKTHKKEFKGL